MLGWCRSSAVAKLLVGTGVRTVRERDKAEIRGGNGGVAYSTSTTGCSTVGCNPAHAQGPQQLGHGSDFLARRAAAGVVFS